MSDSSGIFFGGDYIWIDIPADPTDLLITLPGDKAPAVITVRASDPYKNVWCEGNRFEFHWSTLFAWSLFAYLSSLPYPSKNMYSVGDRG